jgi:AH receptor-interacting protein
MFPIMSKKLRDIARADVDPNFDLSHCETHHCAASGPVKLGYSELDELMGKPRPLMIVFHLLSILRPNEYEQDSWQLNDQQKLASLETIRTEGNRLFSAVVDKICDYVLV